MAGVLLGMGNPLLDISANVDQALLEKYGVRATGLGYLMEGTVACPLPAACCSACHAFHLEPDLDQTPCRAAQEC